MTLTAADSVINFGGSDFDEETTARLKKVLEKLDADIDQAIELHGVPRGVVRTTGQCITYVLLNSTDLYVIAKKTDLLSSVVYTTVTEGRHSADAIHSFAILTLGLENPMVFQIDRSAFENSSSDLRPDFNFASLASEFVLGEYSRMQKSSNLVNVSPIFGPIEYEIRSDLCFVIGPFSAVSSSTYSSIIKPAIESLDLVCHRADEMFTNRAIMSDIWKSICEARIVVADLSGGNPNVYYELGIAHTLGKETILLSSDDGDQIPFDIRGIRQIRFENSPAGGAALREKLSKTIEAIIKPDLATGQKL